MTRQGRALGAAGLVALVLAGCAAGPPQPPPADFNALWIGTVRYDGSDGASIDVTTTPVDQALDAAFSRAPAFRSLYGNAAERARSGSWFDSQGRVIRTDQFCLDSKSECKHSQALFPGHGAYDVLGIGLPMRFSEAGTEGEAALPWEHSGLVATAKRAGNTLIVRIRGEAPATSDAFWHRIGDYEFEAPNAWPSVIRKGAAGDVEYRGAAQGPGMFVRFDPAGRPPTAPAEPAAARDGLAFPGDRRDAFKFGFTPAEVIDWVLNQDPDARRLRESGGCIPRFGLSMPQESGVGPTARKTIRTEVHVVGRYGAGHEWVVDVRPAASPLEDRFTLSSKQPYSHRVSCEAAAPSPWPSHGLEGLLEGVSGIGTRIGNLTKFLFTLGPNAYESVPAAEGWSRFHLLYLPQDSGTQGPVTITQPFRVEFSPHSGRLVRIFASTDAIMNL